MKQVMRELKKPEVMDRFKSIIVDTADIAAEQCQKYICNQLGIENIGDGGWANNGWARYKKEFEDTFRSLTQLGYAVVFISHDKEKTITPKHGEGYQQITATIQSSALSIIENMSDIIAYAHSKVMPDGSTKRVLTMRSNDESIRCGTRFRYMENEIDFSYEALTAALNRAIDKEAAETNNQFVTDEKQNVPILKEYDFDALIQEFTDSVSTLMTINQSNAIKITSIVDKYLGKGKKVGDATPEQSEMIELINQEIAELIKSAQ